MIVTYDEKRKLFFFFEKSMNDEDGDDIASLSLSLSQETKNLI